MSDQDIAPPAWAESDQIARARVRAAIRALRVPLAARYADLAVRRGETQAAIGRAIGKSGERTRAIVDQIRRGYWPRAFYREKVRVEMLRIDKVLG